MGHGHGQPRATVRGHGGAGVEAEPAHPQHARARHRQAQVEGLEGLAPIAAARPEEVRAYQAADAGVDVHHRAAREVERTELRQPAARLPHPVRDRRIDEERPQADEHQHRRKSHAFDDRADDQGRGDHREGELEHGVYRLRHVGRDVAHHHLARFLEVIEPGEP